MTDQVNDKLRLTEEIFRDVVWSSALEVGLVSLFTAAPWLAVPPLKQIVTGIAKLVSGKFYEKICVVIDIQAVSFINAEHRRAYDKASVVLAIIAREKGVNSEEFRDAKENAKAYLAQFLRANG